MKAVIMAGGLGSRLQPLTNGCPKPMVSFVNRPVLDHILALLKHHYFSEVVITVQYEAQQIRNYLGDGKHLGMTIHYAVEETSLGTAGSIKNAQPYLDNETLLVISGDAITNIDLSGVLQFHRERPALATLALKQVADPHQYGIVVTDDNGRVRHYVEKPAPEQVISNTVNTGIYVLEPEVLALMEHGRAYDFSADIFPLLLKQNTLFGYLTDGYWRDIGTIQSYLTALADALTGQMSLISHPLPDEPVTPEVEDRRLPGGGREYSYHKGKEQAIMALLKNQKLYLVYWITLALAVLVSDYILGPLIQFPFLFIIPVTLASWYSGRVWGFVLGSALPLGRLLFFAFWTVPWTPLEASVNALIRICVLLLIAFLVDRTAKQSRSLTKEVQVLKGLLPICGFCKKIRNEDNTWEQLERYISQHSEAQFSHGFCPDCAREHYPEYFNDYAFDNKQAAH
jgi:dTDP-glucose pyrophosphorylase